MENASKALIIAGAILLAILIIGLGMLIFTQAKDSIENTGMDKQKIKVYNSEFEAYVGPNKSGTNIRALCDAVREHNITNQNDDSLKITINDKSTASDINKLKSGVKTGKTYDVEATYDDKTGYITEVKFEESGKTPSGGVTTTE